MAITTIAPIAILFINLFVTYLPDFDKFGVRAPGFEPGNLPHVKRTLYQLSYARIVPIFSQNNLLIQSNLLWIAI